MFRWRVQQENKCGGRELGKLVENEEVGMRENKLLACGKHCVRSVEKVGGDERQCCLRDGLHLKKKMLSLRM